MGSRKRNSSYCFAFGKVLYRKKEPSESFMKSLFEPEDLSKVSSIQHGKHKEVIVRSLYARKMQKQLHKNFTVYDCGFVVNPSHPYLGASPDGKVFAIRAGKAHLDHLKSSAHTSGETI